MFLTRAAVRNSILILMVCIATVVLSQIAVARLPVDLFPNISVPAITIVTTYSGAAPEDVERAVTYPIEQAVTRVAGVQQIFSTSRRGSSTVQVWFDWGTDLSGPEVEIIQNIQRVARLLPAGVSAPAVLKFDISNIPVSQVVVTAPGLDARQLYQLATDTIEPQLERLPGVSQAYVSGGLVRQFNINVDPQRLAAVGLSLQDVDSAVRRYNALVPSGSLRNAQIDFQLKVPTLLQNVAAIRRVVLTTKNGVPVHIADIADVQDAAADQTQIVKVDGQPGIILGVVRQPGANIVEVVNALRAALPRLTGLPPGTSLRMAFDQSSYVRAAIQSLTREALGGAVLTFLVILVFLPNLWNLVIIGLGIPLSVSAALILLYFTGQSLNVFTLGGLTLALGRLVDDAIVVRENITRHLARPGTTVIQAVLDATHEVGTAVFASTATTVAVFFPVVFLTGVSRRLFVPMALTIAFAMSASYLVSMTVDPALSLRLFRRRPGSDTRPQPRRTAIGGFFARLEQSAEQRMSRLDAGYQWLLERMLQRRGWVVAGITALFVVSMAATRFIGSEFFPATDESQFGVLLQEPQGTSVLITSAAADEVARIIREVVPSKDIVTVTTNAGVPSGGFGFAANIGSNYAQISVRLTPPTDRIASSDELAARVRRALEGRFPGVQFFVSVGGLQRNIVNIGAGAPIDVQVLGFDQAVGQQLASQVAAAVVQTPGTADVRVIPRGQYPAFAVHVDSEKAALLGLSPTAVANSITMAMSGNAGTASQLIDPATGAQYGIVTQLLDQYRTHPEDLGNVPLTTLADPGGPPSGRTPILLRDVARVSLSSEPLQVNRKNQQRVIDVTANVVNRPLGAVSAEIAQKLEAFGWPQGFTYYLAGQTEQQQSAFGSLTLAAGLALMLVYMIMASQFKSLVDPFVVMFTVPLGLIGVVWMLLLTHVTLSIMSFMGVITMVGIVVSNGILLVDYANRLQAQGLSPRAAILQAGRLRLRPILMTALATILGMIPMALGLGEGSETNAPLARTVIGGLSVSTFLSLFLIPILYLLFERRGGGHEETAV